VIVATGSAPGRELIGNLAQSVLETPGLERDEVLDVWDVLERGAEVGRRVLVVDDGEGSWKAISLALALDADGHEVHISTPLAYVGAKIGPFSQNRLLPRLFASGIELHPFASLRAVDDAGARLEERGIEVRIDGLDTVILAGWNRPLDRVYLELKDAGIEGRAGRRRDRLPLDDGGRARGRARRPPPLDIQCGECGADVGVDGAGNVADAGIGPEAVQLAGW